MDAKPAKPSDPRPLEERLHDELIDAVDEELELEIDDSRLASLLEHTGHKAPLETLDRHTYFKELLRLQKELVKLQDWVVHEKLKLMVLFEGRDAAGKGGVIKRITQRLNPRICKVVALSAPTERERTQWYFQRYVTHLPAAGEIVLFDRSWYNRVGVERVMGFCSESDCEEFFHTVPEFETDVGAIRHHSRQVLVLDHRRRTKSALPHAHPRSAEAVEAQSDGSGIAPPLGNVHQGQRRNARAHRYSGGPMVGGGGRRQEKGTIKLHPSFAAANPVRGRAS